MRTRLSIGLFAISVLVGPSLASAQPVKFRLKPKSGVASYALAHMSLKCSASSNHSHAFSPCKLQWIAVRHGDVRELRGEYCLQVQWEDGKSYRGAFVAVSGNKVMKLDITPGVVAPHGPCQ